jgi:hypothetical protein
MTALLTPSQTAGPYLAIGLPWPDGPFVVAEGTPGGFRFDIHLQGDQETVFFDV